jgi:hypothetical protein
VHHFPPEVAGLIVVMVAWFVIRKRRLDAWSCGAVRTIRNATVWVSTRANRAIGWGSRGRGNAPSGQYVPNPRACFWLALGIYFGHK